MSGSEVRSPDDISDQEAVMKSTRPYSPNFKKRVDHEGGAHRPAKKLKEPSVCQTCGAIYADGHWALKEFAADTAKHKNWRPAISVVCPACKQIESGVAGGYVSISGGFMRLHRLEILSLIDNEAEHALEDSPLSRVMCRRYGEAQILIETTTEHLAQRLGQKLKNAFGGDVDFDFSHENKVARVNWRRD
jgi:hypothetical protein